MAKRKPSERERWDKVEEYYRNARHLIMDVGWQGVDGVYGLDLDTEERIRAAFPDAPVNPGQLVLSSDKEGNIDRYQRPYWPMIAQILTGLTPEQIRSLGGIELFDPEAGKVLWSWQREVKESA